MEILTRQNPELEAKASFGVGAKIMGLNALLLIFSIIAVIWAATSLYIGDTLSLIKQMNADSATSLALQTRQLLENTNMRATVVGSLLTDLEVQPAAKDRVVRNAFQADADLVAFLIYKTDPVSGKLVLEASSVSPSLSAKPEWMPAKILEELSSHSDVWMKSVIGNATAELHDVKFDDGLQAIALAVPLTKTAGKITNAIVSIVRRSKFEQNFSNFGNLVPYLVDKSGKLLVHPDHSYLNSNPNLSELGIVKLFMEGTAANGQTRFLDPATKAWNLGAFESVGFAGLGVIAEVPETKAMEASGRVKFRAACIALAVLGFSFIAGYLLSRSLTWPLKLLALAATRISAGDFKVSLLVKGNDEIAHLAKTVNHMAKDLESREKMMDMFNKFHNKEVVAKLMANEVKLGGERLNAVIFFSDIRDFTHVSGHMSPEQVVEMLNEYMAIMVRVIRKNGGIVDKFVGDAIMALWGVPERKSHDSFYAVKACLEMRTALAQLNKRRITAGKLPIVIGMGLNSGQVIAGNIGSNEKMEYTVIGDAVNMASRIEGATKTFGTDLLVPKHMRDELDGAYVFGPGETVSVKGKADSFEVFKVLGYYSESGKATLVETPYSKYESKGDDEKAKKPAAKSNVITPTVQTWWVKTSDRVSGPFTWDAILEFFRDGTMDERIQLSENPDGVFRPLRLTPELQEYIAFVKEERMKIGKAG